MNKKLFSSTTNTYGVDYAILILRLVAGGFMLYGHGWSKFQTLMAGGTNEFVNFLGLGASTTFMLVVLAEFLCAILLLVGFMTRLALVPLMITMAYAGFVYHQADGYGAQEKPWLFLAVFVALFLLGPGKHSLDRIIGKAKKTV